MKYQEMFREENEAVLERYQLTMERIASMKEEQTVTDPYRVYFNRVADFILMIGRLWEELQSGVYEKSDLETMKQWNDRLYEDI